MSAITDKDAILAFLGGAGGDHKDRLYSETLEWSDVQLEACHDHIQHIFPLHEDSHMARTWPVVNKEIVEEGKDNPAVLSNLKAAKDRFQSFFGACDGDDNWKIKQDRWCRDGNHNILRITRIIRSLRLFGLETESQDFYKRMSDIAERCGISNISKAYWWRAANEDVWETLR
jgi:hypothetical protein